MITSRSHRSGFTLIELIIFIAIFSFVIVSFIAILVSILNVQSNQSASSEVEQQSEFLLQQIQYYVSSARLADMTQDVATSTLMLREFSSSLDPTIINLASSTVNLQQGGGSLQALTSNKVSVSQLSFTRHYNLSTSSAYGTDSVSYSFTMTATSTNNKSYSQAFQSSAAVFAPVPKIALLQQAKTEASSAVTTIATSYTTNNETSSLLIALVVNATSTTSVSIADTAGNSWNLVASTSYPAFNNKMTVFAALNAKNSSNTVTATFGTGVVGSVFIYEYRGAATSSSFDASSSQIQANIMGPLSGLANPTSTVELLFGATYNGLSTIPSAGNGFTMETSSTVSYAFVEDMDQYITSPVAATWSYSGATSSSVLIATFK